MWTVLNIACCCLSCLLYWRWALWMDILWFFHDKLWVYPPSLGGWTSKIKASSPWMPITSCCFRTYRQKAANSFIRWKATSVHFFWCFFFPLPHSGWDPDTTREALWGCQHASFEFHAEWLNNCGSNLPEWKNLTTFTNTWPRQNQLGAMRGSLHHLLSVSLSWHNYKSVCSNYPHFMLLYIPIFPFFAFVVLSNTNTNVLRLGFYRLQSCHGIVEWVFASMCSYPC